MATNSSEPSRGLSSSLLDSTDLNAGHVSAQEVSMPDIGAPPSSTHAKLWRSDRQWMEIVGGGKKPFRFSLPIFCREFAFNFFFPYSIIFSKCFSPNSEIFLWNRQLLFFGFHASVRKEGWAAGRSLDPEVPPRRASLFALDLGRMLFVVSSRGLLWPMFIVVCYQQYFTDRKMFDATVPLDYDFFAEVVLLWMMSQIWSLFITVKWAFFPDSFDDVLKRERAPQFILLNQQIMTQWSPNLAQTLCSEARVLPTLHWYIVTPYKRLGGNSHVGPQACQFSR